MKFEEKVRSMTSKEIIIAMVDSLIPPPKIAVNMYTYGHVKRPKGIFGIFKKPKCFGCAATNTICQISGKVFTVDNISECVTRAEFVESDISFLSSFECAINELRCGWVDGYNYYAKLEGFARIENVISKNLPILQSDYTKEELDVYLELANAQL